MPRAPRPQVAGGIYHVTMRGNRRQVIFVDEDDYRYFLTTVGVVAELDRWRVFSYVLMGNHFHLFVETVAPTISAGMHRLATRYVQWFNWRHGYEGHLFERRFRSVLVQSEGHYAEIPRYLALNPVRAGLCDRPEDWRWSSYAATIGLVLGPPFLDAAWLPRLFSNDVVRGRTQYKAFVEAGMERRPASVRPLRPRLA